MMYYDDLVQHRPFPSKKKKIRRLVSYLLVSIFVQLLCFYGIESYLTQDKGIAVEPITTTAVKNRSLNLNPPPLLPNLPAISPDRSKLALMDGGHLKLYSLATGEEILDEFIAEKDGAALQWLPDRNRLIIATVAQKIHSTTVYEEIYVDKPTGVQDETYSTEIYRKPKTITNEGFEISLFSLEGDNGARLEVITRLQQEGKPPKTIALNMSTYTNLLYLNWQQGKRDFLAQVDIMKRTKDFRLPSGRLNKLIVTPRDGHLWAEFLQGNDAVIYRYEKSAWRIQRDLEGYRLIGVTPTELLAVAPDLNNQVEKISLMDDQGNFSPGWAFSSAIPLEKVSILKDGRLLYFEDGRVIIHTPQLGKGTVYQLNKVDAYSSDGKMMLSIGNGKLNIVEELTEKVTN